MKIKLSDIINPTTLKALDTLSGESFVPKKSVWPLAKTLAAVKAEVNTWNEARTSAFKKYGTEKDGNITVDPSKVTELNTELIAILETEVEIPLPAPIEIPLELPVNSTITSSDLANLLAAGLVVEKPA